MRPAWISFCCRDGHTLRSGESLAEVAAEVVRADALGNVLGLGVNCTGPEHAEAAVAVVRRCLEQAADHRRRYVVCYPNSGEDYDAARKDWVADSGLRGRDDAFARLAVRLRAAGAEVIGGCCRTTPRTIEAIRAALIC
eukprot:TRINITY_DN14517_c0_g1_i1.p3 TRINITY_DN14517_c0_g1~~TRINITY_DN14517_c0_g1_i1.p3  ORF type:complete len:139 (+),score=11.41 TRINITY_DN14517_c0_g1_i1:746-1162(+)